MSDLCPVAVSLTGRLEDPKDRPKTIVGSLLWLLKSKKFSDVTFTFPDQADKIPAHEFCLQARSSVFEQIFRLRKSGNFQGNEIEIHECTPERFQQFLEFIYSDKFEVDVAGALELLQLSRKYKVHPLTEKCEELLQTEIPIVDSVKVFEAARHYGHRKLMDQAGRIMVESFSELVETGALANAKEETLLYLFQSDDDLAIKDVELFQFILDWGRNQVGSSADQKLLRNKLRNFIPKIRYTNMAPDEFTKAVVPTGLLSAEESLSVYSYFCGDEVTRRDLKINFNTTRRKKKDTVTQAVNFYDGDQRANEGQFLPFPHLDLWQKQVKVKKANWQTIDWGDLFQPTVTRAVNFYDGDQRANEGQFLPFPPSDVWQRQVKVKEANRQAIDLDSPFPPDSIVCPFCTFHNPKTRVLCEICEQRLKNFQK